jgi:hypothetical protein
MSKIHTEILPPEKSSGPDDKARAPSRKAQTAAAVAHVTSLWAACAVRARPGAFKTPGQWPPVGAAPPSRNQKD